MWPVSTTLYSTGTPNLKAQTGILSTHTNMCYVDMHCLTDVHTGWNKIKFHHCPEWWIQPQGVPSLLTTLWCHPLFTGKAKEPFCPALSSWCSHSHTGLQATLSMPHVLTTGVCICRVLCLEYSSLYLAPLPPGRLCLNVTCSVLCNWLLGDKLCH